MATDAGGSRGTCHERGNCRRCYPPPAAEAQSAPARPASVTLTRADGTLTAAWPSVAGATSYHITYTSNGGASWSLAALNHPATADTTTITINAANDATYIVGVRARNTNGDSGWRNSPPAGPYTPPAQTPPARPASVTLTRADGTLTAAWPSVAGATSYHITYTSNGGASWSLAALNHPATADTTTITINAANDATYIVGVRARNASGDSGWRNSPPAGPYTPPAQAPPVQAPPSTPTGLTATVGDGSVALAWDDPSDPSITGYQYKSRAAPPAPGWGPWTPIANSDSGTASHTVEGLNNGTEYRFKVRAVNAAGNSPPAPRGAPWYIAATPAPPTLTADDPTPTSVTLTLGNYNGQWYYRAQSQPGGDANGASAASGASDCTGPADGAHAQATGLDPDTTYTFTAYTNTGCTQQIAQASAQTGSTAAPSLTVGDVTRSSATLTIDGHSGNWHYKANWGPHSSCSAAVAASTASLSGLSTATHYVYVAYSDAQCSTRLASAEFATSPRYANHPSLEVNEGTLTFDSVTLDPYPWGSSWWYKSDKAPHNSICNGPVVNAGSLAITGLEPATAYTYTMYDYSDCETDMAEISFTTSALPAVTLETSNLNGHRVILTPKGFSRSWYYENSSICTGPVGPGGVTINLPLPGHEYTYAAHAYAGCEASSQLGDAITFQAPYPTLGVESFNAWGGQLTLTGWDKAWYYYEDLDGVVGNNVCKSVPAGTSTALINLKPGQRYKYVTLRSLHGGCAALGYSLGPPGQVTFTAPQLSASTTATTAELTLTNWSAPWYYQQSLSGSPFGACSGPVTPVSGTGTATITGLTASSTYDYKVYKDGSCRYKSVIDIVRFTTATPGLSIAPHNPDNPNGWYRISISGWDADWWVKETFTNTLGCSKVNAGGTKDIKESAFGAVYRFFRAYSASGCDAANQLATVELRRIERDTLTASNITGDTATLSLKLLDKDYPGLWYVRQISPTTGPCSPGTAISQQHQLSSLTPGTLYTYKAHTAYNCHPYFERATVTFGTVTSLTASNITDTTATLTVADYTGEWWLKRTAPADTACTAQTTSTVSLTNLTPGQSHTYKAYFDNSCTIELSSTASTFTTLVLTAKPVAWKSATLTLSGHTGDWWLKRTTPADTACTAQTTSTVSLTNLTPGQSHTYKAYSDNTCTTRIATASFTTSTAAPALNSGTVRRSSATLTLANYTGDWWLKRTTPADTACTAQTTSTVSLTNLTPGQSHTYKAYSDNTCTTELASETFTTLELTASTVTWNAATLTLANYTGDWWLKRTTPADTACTAQTTSTVSFTNLNASTSYTYAAYFDSNCTTQLDTASFTTPASAPGLTSNTVTWNSATLTLANVTGDWWLKRTTPADTACTAQTTSTVSFTNLNVSTSYTYAAYFDSNCTTQLDTASFTTTAQPSLDGWDDNHKTVYADLYNWNYTWYIRVREPLGQSWTACYSVNAGARFSYVYAGGILGGGVYAFRAYSDSSCSNQIAAEDHTA